MQAKLMEMAALGQLIKGIGLQRVAFDGAVQQAAVECVGQSIVYRNITPAMDLLEAVGSHLKPVVVAFFERFGNIAWAKSEKKLKFHELIVAQGHDAAKCFPIGSKVEWTEEYSALVTAFVWTKAKKETMPTSVYDVQEEADKFLERLLKAAKKGATLKHKELLERLSDTFNRYSAETYLAKVTTAPTEDDIANASTPVEKAKLEALREHFGGRPQAVKAA